MKLFVKLFIIIIFSSMKLYILFMIEKKKLSYDVQIIVVQINLYLSDEIKI